MQAWLTSMIFMHKPAAESRPEGDYTPLTTAAVYKVLVEVKKLAPSMAVPYVACGTWVALIFLFSLFESYGTPVSERTERVDDLIDQPAVQQFVPAMLKEATANPKHKG